MNVTSLLSLVEGKEQKRQLRGILRDRNTASWRVAGDLLEDCGQDAQANRLRAVLDLMDAFQGLLESHVYGSERKYSRLHDKIILSAWGGPIELRLRVVCREYLNWNTTRSIVAQSNYQRCRLDDRAYCWKKNLHNATRTMIFLECHEDVLMTAGEESDDPHGRMNILLEVRGFYEV